MKLKFDIKKVMGVLLGLVVLGEGAFLMWYARPAEIGGFGGILAQTVVIGGAILALFGVVMVLAWVLKDINILRSRKKLYRILSILVTAAHLVLLILVIGLTVNASSVFFDGGIKMGRFAADMLFSHLIIISSIATMLWLKRDSTEKNTLSFMAGVVASTGYLAIGAFVIGCAAPLEAQYLIGVGEGKMTIFGSILMVVGILNLVAWFLAGTKLQQNKFRLVWDILITSSSVGTAIVAIYLASVASDFILDFSNGHVFNGTINWFVGFTAALFMISLLSVAAWFVKEKTFNIKFIFQAFGMAAGIFLATLGLIVFGFSGDVHVDGFGTLPRNLILMFAGQMMLLGCMATASWVLKETKYFNFGFRKTALDLMMLMLMSIVIVDGIAALMIAAPTQVVGVTGFLGSTVWMFGASVALTGLFSLLAWTFRENPATPRLKRLEFLVFMFWALMTVAALTL